MTRPVILVLVKHYLPGYKAGGPLRTIANMVDQLGDQLDLRILTTDRDLGDDRPFGTVKADEWTRVAGASVYYASPSTQSLVGLARVVRETPHQVLYLNSYFEPVFAWRPLMARRLGLIPHVPLIIAPRGEFSEGALAMKRAKKLAYRVATAVAGLHRHATWQASSEHESADIRRFLGVPADDVVVAPDLPGRGDAANGTQTTRREGEPLRVCFVSRISPKKNLDCALRILTNVSIPVVFNIFGPQEDREYWERCQALMRRLPAGVSAHYRGFVKHDEIDAAFRAHDLFLFPTRGENFGHVILESMRAGTPVLITDTTPWRDLKESGVGWDLPLNDVSGFVAAIEEAYATHGATYDDRRERVRRFALARSVDQSVLAANRRLFVNIVGRGQ